MVKRIFLTLLMLLILVYLALAVSVLNEKPKAMVCTGLKLDIKTPSMLDSSIRRR